MKNKHAEDTNNFKELSYEEEFYFQWHITDVCNLRCKHCYHEEYSQAGLSIDNLKKIGNHLCDALEKWQRKGAFSITGGEPFTRKQDVFELLNLLESRNVERIDILTNGILIDEKVADELKKFKKIRRIQVSLEGLEETNDKIRGKGSFKEILEKINLLKSRSLPVCVMMTVGSHNKNEVIPLAEKLGSVGVDAFVLDRFIPEGQSGDKKKWVLSADELKQVYKDAYEYFNKSLKPRFLLYRTLFCLLNSNDPHIGAMCSIGNNALTILPNGDVLPCRRLPIKLGNLLETSIYDIWYTSPLLWEIRNPDNLKGKCRNCEYIPACRGCRAFAYAMTGDYLEADPQCWRE